MHHARDNFLRKFRGEQSRSCGVQSVRKKLEVFETLASIVPTTHLLKITARLLLTHYSISLFYQAFASEKRSVDKKYGNTQCSLAVLLIAQLPLNHSIASERGAQTAKRPYGKAFFAKLFCASKNAEQSSMQCWCISCYFFVHTKK